MSLELVLGILVGLGIFLFGIYHMSASLKKLAGSKLKMIIEKSTNTPIKGVLVGFAITAIIQSSSGTTAIVVGLITAGLLSLPQAIAIIIGANIGTTVTSILIGLNIGQYAPILILVGAIMLFFFKNKFVHNLGNVLVGFGLLFFGLETMGDKLGTIASEPWFTNSLDFMTKNPIIGFIGGIGLTAVVQSSSATIGIVQSMYNVADGISLYVAIPFILGANVGTTITGILASISGSRDAKRAALFHFMFNLIGSVIFMCALTPFVSLLELIQNNIGFFSTNKSAVIAFSTVVFNLVVSLLLFWFIKYFVKLIEKIIPYSEQEKNISISDKLNERLIASAPSLALASAQSLIVTMCDVIKNMVTSTFEYVKSYDKKKAEEIKSFEEIVDNYDSKLHDYLTRIPSSVIGLKASSEKTKYLDTIGDLERIGDHCTNILELMEERYQSKLTFQGKSLENITLMTDSVLNMVDKACLSFIEDDSNIATEVEQLEPTIDAMEKDMRREEITLLDNGESTDRDLNFVDILSNLERIGDHSNNIAQNVIYHGLHEGIAKEN